ncbi:MFS transporter [Fictibacillus sp. BK138]|uniref:MFS transporter n=1 Tax=Fictibacillus sp. BK138 TaxID=2512121 RepID=UPI001029B70A|nr:MFS transporter [Fictibacillus sp. BK138]RZT15525.1 putative MFS family arabinose efflux permease [Fictibacillus sp. BK138]
MKKVALLYTKAFSEMGTIMEMVVMNTIIYMETGSATWLAALFILRVAGGLISSLFSGVLADRFDRRLLMIISDLARVIFLLLLIVLPNPLMFLISAFVLGFFSGFFNVSFNAEVPQIFGEDKVLITNAMISRLSAISMVVGFLASAMLSSFVDYRLIIAIDAFTFLLSALVLFLYKWKRHSDRKIKSNMSWSSDIKEVTGFIRENPVLGILFALFLVQTFAASSHNLGIPLLAEKINPNNITYYQGIIWGVWGGGCILSTMIINKISFIKRNYFLSYIGISIMISLCFILVLSTNNLWLILPSAFVTGVFDAGASTIFTTMVQKSDNVIRGRVFGVVNLVNRLGFMMGFIIASIMIKLITMPQLVWLFHGMVLVTCVLIIMLCKKKKTLMVARAG